ncbi:hypothetical protein [Caulobacter hibisci]|uniref:Uncharacterized protein n=1 Tax=Caulobacter hibisci TaxID=2035993 RepID=A0ABS0T3C1_9CAUL|nr:hypothetical protein [Caulobacter hibisci]MBI1686159.1 hypothetical protein [Caulobacter hibisci]
MAALATTLLAASAAQALAGEATIGELVGLTPAQVRARLTGAPADTPMERGFEVAEDGGTTAYLTLDQLLSDPRQARQRAVWRTYGEAPRDPETPVCRSRLASGPATLTVGDPVLAFRDGRLAGALRPARRAAKPPAPSLDDREAYFRWTRQATPSPFVAAFGQLPLEDGEAFLGRWSRGRLDPAERLSVDCAPLPRPVIAAPAKDRVRGLTHSDMQGLALLPFAVKLPGMNRDRARARERGAATLAGLAVGMRLPQGPAAFARGQDGLRWQASARPGYGVLTIDLGGWPTRNLSDKRDAALVGVHDGVVEWISTPDSPGPPANLLCIDAQGQAGEPRRGCHGWGIYRP